MPAFAIEGYQPSLAIQAKVTHHSSRCDPARAEVGLQIFVVVIAGSGSVGWLSGHPCHRPNGWGRGCSDTAFLRPNAASDRPPKTNLDDATVPSETPSAIPTPMADELHPRLCSAVPSAAPKQRPTQMPTTACLPFMKPLDPRVPQFPRPTGRDLPCALVSSGRERRRDTLAGRNMIMSASRRPTDIHLRQYRAKKRAKLLARIAAGPASGRAALEARVERTYSRSHSMTREKRPPTVV